MQAINEVIKKAECLAQNGKIEKGLEIFLDAIDECQPVSEELANETAFQMGWFLFGQKFYVESIETWKKLQEKGYRKDVISQIVEEAFIMPNVKEFRSVYEKNLEEHAKQIHTRTSCHFEEFPYWFIPATDGVYYLYGKISREIGGKVVASGSMYSDDEILGGENAFDATVFWKDWDYIEPIKTKQRNSKQMVYFLSDGILPFSYLQLPEFGDVFQEEWHIFGSLEDMKLFFQEHKGLPLPRLYKGIRGDAEVFRAWIESEHKFRCSQEGRDNRDVLLTIGIPSYNRGHRALKSIEHLRKLSYDSEVEFLVCDNCSQVNVEGYREIERLAESDCRIAYYRFPDNPGGNITFAETVERASGKFCFMVSDEDMVYLDNVWKYLYLIQKYGDRIGFIKAAGKYNYWDNVNGYYKGGEEAFDKLFWSLNYLSGSIFSTEKHRKLKLSEEYGWPTDPAGGNEFAKAYPHNAAAMRCAVEEDIYTCGEMLFQEGKDDFEKIGNGAEGQGILSYARVDSRLKQLAGITLLLNKWKDMLPPRVIKNSYARAVSKVFWMLKLYQQQGGIVECSFREAYDRVLRASVEGIKALEVVVSDRVYANMVTSYSQWYKEYVDEIAEEEGNDKQVKSI